MSLNITENGFSLCTNTTANDLPRLRVVIPHWIKVFGNLLNELLVVVDTQPTSGRLRVTEGAYGNLAAVRSFLDEVCKNDQRIRVIDLPTGPELEDILGRWFGVSQPIRCQAGTPIAAFVCALDAAHGPIVLKADCDMLFYDAGWITEAHKILKSRAVDLVEPCRCGLLGDPKPKATTRAMIVDMHRWKSEILPLKVARLDFVRRLDRWFKGLPFYLPLEQMIEKEIDRGRIKIKHLPDSLGCWLHVASREEFLLPIIHKVVAAVERGDIPEKQRQRIQLDRNGETWDFYPPAWDNEV